MQSACLRESILQYWSPNPAFFFLNIHISENTSGFKYEFGGTEDQEAKSGEEVSYTSVVSSCQLAESVFLLLFSQ